LGRKATAAAEILLILEILIRSHQHLEASAFDCIKQGTVFQLAPTLVKKPSQFRGPLALDIGGYCEAHPDQETRA
jgi:hypothetical protein